MEAILDRKSILFAEWTCDLQVLHFVVRAQLWWQKIVVASRRLSRNRRELPTPDKSGTALTRSHIAARARIFSRFTVAVGRLPAVLKSC